LGNCGGALIAPSVVLTAAHCSDYKGKTIKVGAFSRGKDTKNSFKRKVVDDYLHPNFRKSNYQDDFSLLKLDKEVPMDHTDITLSVNFDPTVPKISDTVTVIGMGILEHGSHQLADKVRHLDMSVISDEQCSKDFHGKPVIEVQFCAGKI
jgi:secreted trypsin-like serine protease